MKNKLMSNKSKGFTLIELLVVIAIIGILAVVVLSALSSARKAANDAKRKENINSLLTGMETYMATNNKYPNQTTLASDIFNGTLPKDPVTNADYNYLTMTDSTFCIIATLDTKSGSSTQYFVASPTGARLTTTASCD